MITFDELLKNAKEKGYRPLFPPFGDEHLGRPGPHASFNVQRVELVAITAWVKINLKNKLHLEFDENIIYQSLIKAMEALSEKIAILPYCAPADGE